jgi:5'-nucleotidase
MLVYLLLATLTYTLTPITILATNDIHGKLFSDTKKFPNHSLKIGGLSLFASYLKVLRKTEENLLWLDAGDQYTGTLESQFFKGKPMSEAFNYLKLDIAAPGNHDFDFGLQSYEKSLERQQYVTLFANISP